MSIALVTFAAAPLDRMARIITRSMWPMAVVLALLGGLYLLAGATATGVMLFVVAALGAALHWHLRRLMPVECIVEEGRFTVRRRKASPRSFAGNSSSARRGRLSLVGLSVARSGGVYGYLGHYRADGHTVHAFVTHRARVVLIDVGGAALAVSPADPDDFVERIGYGA